jgi:pimeloyl-ACP methyl ester carboxylesterase
MTGRRSVAVDCNWLRQAFALVSYLFCHIIILPCQRLSVYVWTDYLAWNWKGKAIRVGYDLLGKGPTLLLLPALSSISTRHEMRPLQERLASAFSTITIDWPGFGDQPRPALAWEPAGYVAFLRHVITQLHLRPFATVAAGHAATYALSLAADVPGSLGRLCLIAPTWRGPLPTVMQGRRGLGAWITRAGDLPIIGAVLYRINVNGPVVRIMARGHVYSDPNWLAGKPLEQKMAVTKAPGARYASIRFVTGTLDLISDRASFIELVKRVKDPILVLYGSETPRRSKAEMEALVSLTRVKSVELPHGKLAVHEEFPDVVAKGVNTILYGSATESV